MQYPTDRTRIHRSESENGRLEMALRAPSAALRELVRGYCLYDEARRRASAHQHLPHRDVIFIVSLGGRLEVRDASGARRGFGEGEGFLGGLHTLPALTESGPRQHGVEVKLTPLATHLLLDGIPMHEVTNRTLALEDLLGSAGRELAARLCETRGYDQAFQVLEDFFTQRILGPERALPGAVVQAWRLLEASHGSIAIGEIAARFGCSRKQLVAAFREHLGLPPKTLARVLRFDRAMEMLKQQPGLRWSEAALACGYYDQAHLNREVLALSGSTPGQLSRRLLPESGGMTAP